MRDAQRDELATAFSRTKLTKFATIISFHFHFKLDGCIVWNAHNTVLGKEALLIYIVPVCHVKQVGMVNLVISLLVYTGKNFNYCEYCTNY